jgi:hypothetical protein
MEFKPCPFCGSRNIRKEWNSGKPEECFTCRAVFNMRHADHWNERANPVSFATFCAALGCPTEADIESHIHAGLRSMDKAALTRYRKTLKQMHAQIQDATHAYQALIEAGIITRPVEPTIDAIASGHPDNPATEAARRILAKKAARAKNAHTESHDNV